MRIACLFLLLISLGGCDKSSQKEEQKPLIVIISPDNPPFEFKETAQAGDHVIGFDVDVVKKLSQHLGLPIKIVEADFAAIIPSLQSGRADMGISTIVATDERRKSVDFSDPYYAHKLALLVPEDSSVTSEKDLSDKKLGVQLGSSHEVLAQKWQATLPGLSLVSLNKGGELVQELKNSRIQAVLTEETTAHKIAASTAGIKVVVLEVPGEELVIAFPKGSSWVGPTNQALKAMKEDIEKIADKWISD